MSNNEYLITMKTAEEVDDKLCSFIYGIYVIFKVVFRIAFVILNNIYCIPTYCIWMVTFFPLRKLYPSLYWKLEGLFFHWLLAMVSMWSWSAGYDIVEVGDDIRICLDERTLVVANHQSTSDVPMLMANFNARKGVLPNIMWIMDWGRKQRDQGVRDLRNHLRKSYIPRHRKLMVLFPEGGFLSKRKEASQRYAEKNNLAVLNYVTLPRLGAFQSIIDELTSPKSTKYGAGDSSSDADLNPADSLKWVLDITVAYPNGNPLDLPTIITGYRSPCKTYLCYRLYPISEVPRETEEMTKWLFDRWVEKDKMLQYFYQTGEFQCESFCNKPQQPQMVHQDPFSHCDPYSYHHISGNMANVFDETVTHNHPEINLN